MANGCELNSGTSTVRGLSTTTDNGLCYVLASMGEVAPGCFQRNPSNECPVAQYSRGEITLEEAKKLLENK